MDRGGGGDGAGSREALVGLLAVSLSPELARRRVGEAMAALGLEGGALAREDALRVLGELERSGGVTGMAARFARTRVFLEWARS